jgi:hypothetical protein
MIFFIENFRGGGVFQQNLYLSLTLIPTSEALSSENTRIWNANLRRSILDPP